MQILVLRNMLKAIQKALKLCFKVKSQLLQTLFVEKFDQGI
jgi:hypothetical protein